MKRSITAFLALLMIISLFSCKKSQDLPTLPQASAEEESKVPENGEKLFFDENGNLRKIIKYENGAIVFIREYSESRLLTRYTEYTESGHFVEDKAEGNITLKISYYDSSASLIEAISYAYHENGVVAEETEIHSDGSVKGARRFDESGSITERDFYVLDSGGYLFLESAKYFYKDSGFPDKTAFYKAENVLSSEIYYSDSGEVEKTVYYGSDGEISYYTLFEYHENGETKSESTYSGYGVITSLLLYSESKEKISLTNYSESGLPSLIYLYAESGEIKEISRYTDSGELSSTEYFGEGGLRTGSVFYNSDGTSLVCDASFSPIEGVQYTKSADGGYVKRVYESSYIREETVCTDGVNLDTIRTFDESGYLSKEVIYKNGSFDLTRSYVRDENGEVVTYTEEDLVGSRLTYLPDGLLLSGVRYVYSKGYLAKKVEYENSLPTSETLYTDGKVALVSIFNENGVLIKESFYSSGKIARVKEYYENGILKKDTVYNSRGKVSSVTKYDENGNQI